MQLSLDQMRIRTQDLVDNPTTRVPICLVLDTSGSMHGSAINELNDGVAYFFQSILDHDIARYAAEIAIVSFGNTVDVCVDFMSVERQTTPRLTADGPTPMGHAVNLALDLLDLRKSEYKDQGIEYYQPWLVLMTDGDPTDNIDYAAQRTIDLVNRKKLTLFPIGIGPHVNMGTLSKFSPNRAPVKLQGLHFREFFQWLSKSVERTSQSTVGEEVQLPSINGWASL